MFIADTAVSTSLGITGCTDIADAQGCRIAARPAVERATAFVTDLAAVLALRLTGGGRAGADTFDAHVLAGADLAGYPTIAARSVCVAGLACAAVTAADAGAGIGAFTAAVAGTANRATGFRAGTGAVRQADLAGLATRVPLLGRIRDALSSRSIAGLAGRARGITNTRSTVHRLAAIVCH